MTGGWRRTLLVLTLIAGVFGMHALVLISTAPAADDQMFLSPVAMAPASAPDGPDPASIGAHDPATEPAEAAMATAMAMVQPAVDDLDHSALPGHGAGHDPMPSSMHQVLHLCLAILVALLVLGTVALTLWSTRRPDQQGTSIGELIRRAPRRRPPPTSVRLAQLCVLRN